MRKAQPLPVIFLKAVRRGDTRTADLLGANPVLMPDTHLETRTRQDGVTQTYHVSNAAPEKPLHFAALDLGLGLDTPAATADPLAGIAATDPRRESIQTLATWDAPRAQRAAALLVAMTRNDLGAIGRLYGAMTLKEAEAASLDVGFGVPRARSKQELLTYLHPQMMEAIRQRQAPKATAEVKEPPKLKRVTAQKDSPAPLTDSAIGSSLKVERGGVSQAPQAGASPMTNTPDPLGLDKPETYQADPVLATLARRLAERDFATHSAGSIGRGALKQEYLEGKHAGAVAAALDEEAAKAGKAKAEADAKAAAQQAREDHLYRAYAEHLAMQEAWPYGARFHGEQYMAARPWYWVSGDGKTVRIVIVNLSGKEISKSCVVPADEFYARPKPNRITKAEAEWAFGKCGYRP